MYAYFIENERLLFLHTTECSNEPSSFSWQKPDPPNNNNSPLDYYYLVKKKVHNVHISILCIWILLCRPQLTKEALSISASYFSCLSSLTPASQQHKTEKLTRISTFTTLSPPYSLNIWVLFFLVLLLLLSWFVFCSYIVSNHIVPCTVLDLLCALIFVITIWTLSVYTRRGFINWSSVCVCFMRSVYFPGGQIHFYPCSQSKNIRKKCVSSPLCLFISFSVCIPVGWVRMITILLLSYFSQPHNSFSLHLRVIKVIGEEILVYIFYYHQSDILFPNSCSVVEFIQKDRIIRWNHRR